jgi:hypothetical protein
MKRNLVVILTAAFICVGARCQTAKGNEAAVHQQTTATTVQNQELDTAGIMSTVVRSEIIASIKDANLGAKLHGAYEPSCAAIKEGCGKNSHCCLVGSTGWCCANNKSCDYDDYGCK